MLIEVKTHSPAKRQRKWYFNIWSLNSFFLAFASKPQAKGRTSRKVIGRGGGGGWGIFEPQEFFSSSNSLCEFFFRP